MSDLTSVRAKMHCQSMDTQDFGSQKLIKVNLGAVYGKEGENADFADATPSGACWMQINEERAAATFFKPGKRYYVTFTEASD